MNGRALGENASYMTKTITNIKPKTDTKLSIKQHLDSDICEVK